MLDTNVALRMDSKRSTTTEKERPDDDADDDDDEVRRFSVIRCKVRLSSDRAMTRRCSSKEMEKKREYW